MCNSLLGCSFQVARAFGGSVRVSFREGPPSDTDTKGLRDTGSEDENRRQSLYDYDPTYHLTSAELRSQIQIRVSKEDGFSLEAPTAVLEVAGRALAKTQMIGESANPGIAPIASVFLKGFGDVPAIGFDYKRNFWQEGHTIQIFHKRPVTEAVKRTMTDHTIKAVGSRIRKLRSNGEDPSALQEELALLSEEISEAGLSEKTAKVTRDLADYVE